MLWKHFQGEWGLLFHCLSYCDHLYLEQKQSLRSLCMGLNDVITIRADRSDLEAEDLGRYSVFSFSLSLSVFSIQFLSSLICFICLSSHCLLLYFLVSSLFFLLFPSLLSSFEGENCAVTRKEMFLRLSHIVSKIVCFSVIVFIFV